MWAADSPDLVHWGRHSLLMSPRPETWEAGRIGGGSVPFRTERGWLAIYHGADQEDRYSLGAMLCDGDDPTTSSPVPQNPCSPRRRPTR